MRLNKYISHSGLCSRRDADRLIEEGRVLVNGATAAPGMKVSEGDTVTVDGKAIMPTASTVILAYNKPVGVTCTERDHHAKRTVLDEISYPVRVTYAGRLDRDSEGLLLLSNDGDIINALMKGSHGHSREYLVTIDTPVTDDLIEGLCRGVYLEELGVTTRPCTAIKTGDVEFRITLTQGLNRQIRRMCSALGANVTSLKRIRIENIFLGDLKPGEYRELTDAELAGLKGIIEIAEN